MRRSFFRQKSQGRRNVRCIQTKIKAIPDRQSRPARARGLKQAEQRRIAAINNVAPRAGAWIETCDQIAGLFEAASRPARARGLKPRHWRSPRRP